MNLNNEDTEEEPWATCDLCNYDLHQCSGCGDNVTHEQGRCCDKCREEIEEGER